MNFALTDEQALMREAARGALERVPSFAAARAALDGEQVLDLWPLACDAGWTGLLIDSDSGGAGLGLFEALIVAEECGRALAGLPLIGHLIATELLSAAGARSLDRFAAGDARATMLLARPPGDLIAGWTVDPIAGAGRASLPAVQSAGAEVTVSGLVPWTLDAPDADLLVCVATDERDVPRGVAVAGDAPGLRIDDASRYDATRLLGHVQLEQTPGELLEIDAGALSRAWYVAQALLAAESLGAAERALEITTAYAKERRTFGRPIGSYQGVKHPLTEVLRLVENTRSLLYYAGWASTQPADELALASSAARGCAGHALDRAAREMIAIHGGIGVTWEHDAQLFLRRSQLSRRLLGGTADATDRVVGQLLGRLA